MSEIETIAESRITVLDELHRRLRAAMGEREGWAVPSTYGDLDKEYSAVRDGGAGMIDLSSRARINVSGSEAVQFLNGLVTNDVKTLDEGMWMRAAFPNVQGRLLAIVRVLHYSGGFLFDTEAVTRDAVFNTLQRFTLAGDFRVSDLTDEMAAITLQGPGAAELVDKVLGSDASQAGQCRVIETRWREQTVCVIRATHTGEDGFDIFVPSLMAPALWESLTDKGAVPVGFDAFEILRIEAGLPRYGVDVDVTNVVLEAGLDDAVSFTKGCYIGQEIIARIHWRGHVAKRTQGVMLGGKGLIKSGDKVFSIDDKQIGRVTSTCFSPRLDRSIGLAMIKYDFLTPGTPARIKSETGEVGCCTADLPLVRGSWSNLTSAGSITSK